MLNLFPIQFLAPIAHTLLRFCIGIVFLYLGKKHIQYRNQRTLNMNVGAQKTTYFIFLGILEIFCGLLIVLGAWTQVATLLGLLLTLIQICKPRVFAYHESPSRIFFVLLFFTLMSLFITGAGAFAFDLPI